MLRIRQATDETGVVVGSVSFFAHAATEHALRQERTACEHRAVVPAAHVSAFRLLSLCLVL